MEHRLVSEGRLQLPLALLDGIEQLLCIERFPQKGNGVRGLGRCGFVGLAFTAHENHRKFLVLRLQLSVQLKTTHARHAHVKDQNAWRLEVLSCQEIFSAIVRAYFKAMAFEYQGQHSPDVRVVVYDFNSGSLMHGLN
nr:hypothetical protein [Limnohabitans sp. Jir72]